MRIANTEIDRDCGTVEGVVSDEILLRESCCKIYVEEKAIRKIFSLLEIGAIQSC